MTIREIRYFFEHKLLPMWFFQKKEELIAILLDKNANMPFVVMNDICEKEGVKMTYEPTQYNSVMYVMTKEITMVMLNMPKPESEPLCHRIYLVFDKDYKKLGYFTVEEGNKFGNFMCGWDKDGSHINYGSCPSEQKQELIKIMDIYTAASKR